jgi:histidinol dehydrogenase
VDDFVRRTGVVSMSRAALEGVGDAAMTLASLEGLGAHAASIAVRLSRKGGGRAGKP